MIASCDNDGFPHIHFLNVVNEEAATSKCGLCMHCALQNKLRKTATINNKYSSRSPISGGIFLKVGCGIDHGHVPQLNIFSLNVA